MAAASLRNFCEEALCSICLEYFKDPVTIECGHNFCRACLTRYWDGSEGEEVSCCPQCRGNVRRHLIPNRQLANFVDLTKRLCLQGEPSHVAKGGSCGKHQEPLKLFCKEDESPLCVVCKESKEHRDHQVFPLEEAVQDYKDLIRQRLELLQKETVKILTYAAETEEESQELLKQMKAEMEKTKEQFREMSSFLNEQENLMLAQLEEVEKEITRNRDEHLATLSRELSSLGSLIQEMEEKRQQPPSELLQDVRNILQRYEEKKEPFQNPVAFPLVLKWEFRTVCDRNACLAKRMKQLRDILLPGSKLQKAKVTLYPNTASPRLVLSQDGRSVRNEGSCQDLPDDPERFDTHPFVLGSEGFGAGRHYWEVSVEGEGDWTAGVAKKSVRRKGVIGVYKSTKEGIWAVGKWAGEYRVFSDQPKYFLPQSGKLRRIWVSLDYEGEQVSFHDADTGSHIHTFSEASFSGETLLPFFGLWKKASLTISP